MRETLMELEQVSCGYGSKTLVHNISMKVKAGEILCLLGPNGVGKTTLFKTILGFLKLKSGKILIEGEEITNWSRKQMAKAIAYVPQSHQPAFLRAHRCSEGMSASGDRRTLEGHRHGVRFKANPGHQDLDVRLSKNGELLTTRNQPPKL